MNRVRGHLLDASGIIFALIVSLTPLRAVAQLPAEIKIATHKQIHALLTQTGDSLLSRHKVGSGHGWTWRSVIQSPHFQTDRDVGAAGIAMGLLGLWESTHNASYLRGAERAGDWLLSIAVAKNNTLSWRDWVDGHTYD